MRHKKASPAPDPLVRAQRSADAVVRNRSGTNTLVWWHQDLSRMVQEDPHVREALAAREQMLLDIGAVRTPKRSPRSPTLEAAGAVVLAAAPRERPKRPWVVRVHYVAGQAPGDGERVYAEFGGLTEPQAAELVRVWRAHHPQSWAVKRPREDTCKRCDGEGEIECETGTVAGGTNTYYLPCHECRGDGRAELPAPTPLEGHRRVEFPSERPESVCERADTEAA